MTLDISILRRKTLKSIDVDQVRDEILFTTTKGEKYIMCHIQDCCEDVTIEDITGDLDNLIGTPILYAKEISDEDPNAVPSGTYTFYKLATVKGWVDIRWYGESNGYYSESVDFARVRE